jgi:hypothetical protein
VAALTDDLDLLIGAHANSVVRNESAVEIQPWGDSMNGDVGPCAANFATGCLGTIHRMRKADPLETVPAVIAPAHVA